MVPDKITIITHMYLPNHLDSHGLRLTNREALLLLYAQQLGTPTRGVVLHVLSSCSQVCQNWLNRRQLSKHSIRKETDLNYVDNILVSNAQIKVN